MKHIFILVLAFIWTLPLMDAQKAQVHFSFESCSYQDVEGKINDIQFLGNPECICGPVNEAISLPNALDVVWIDGQVGNIMSSDFSMSFYLNLGNVQGQQLVDIISNERVCFGDSSFIVQFDPIDNMLNMYFIVAASRRVKLSCPLDMNQCWHHIAVTRNKVFFTLYNNGLEVDDATFSQGVNINISANRDFTIGKSVCMGQKFVGAVDEIKFFTSQLTPNEVNALYTPVDEILTRDTVLILGNTIIPRISNSCATSYLWTPDDGSISDINSDQPDLEPMMNTQYVLNFNHVGCIARDTLNVVVVDPDDVHCDQLFLPTAFTPNGDGVNDVYGISNAYIIDEMSSFDIFDKWGGIVFSTSDKNQKWDGIYKNKLINSGVFIYKIVYICDGEEYFRKGSFTILR